MVMFSMIKISVLEVYYRKKRLLGGLYTFKDISQ